MPKILAIDDVLDNLITVESILKSYLPDCQVFPYTPAAIDAIHLEYPFH